MKASFTDIYFITFRNRLQLKGGMPGSLKGSETVVCHTYQLLKLARIVSRIDSRLSRNESEIYKSLEIAVESMHSLEGSGLDRAGDHLDLVFKDKALNSAGAYHYFCCKSASVAVGGRKELLRDNAADACRELRADRCLQIDR